MTTLLLRIAFKDKVIQYYGFQLSRRFVHPCDAMIYVVLPLAFLAIPALVPLSR